MFARDDDHDRIVVFHRDVGNRWHCRESMASRRAASSRARGSEKYRTHSARRHRMYVVIGATGHTGNVVAEKLLANREKVRVVGRDERRLERFKQRGAEAFVGDVTDASAMV